MKSFIVVLLGLFSVAVSAQTPAKIVRLWGPKNPAPTHQVVSEAETIDEHGFVRNIHQAEMLIFPACPNVANSGKAFILMPGGAYAGASMKWEGTAFAELLNPIGVTVMVLKYRMPNGNHRIPMEDAMQALQMARDSAAVWGGYSGDKIGVMGFSAGGHLAAALSVYADPAYSILFYPVISADQGKGHDYSMQQLTGGNAELMDYYSLEKHAHSKIPKTLIIHCSQDNAVPLASSEVYRAALIKQGVEVTSVVYQSSDHGFGLHPRFGQSRDMQKVLTQWILGL